LGRSRSWPRQIYSPLFVGQPSGNPRVRIFTPNPPLVKALDRNHRILLPPTSVTLRTRPGPAAACGTGSYDSTPVPGETEMAMPCSTKRKEKVVRGRNMEASGCHFQDRTGCTEQAEQIPRFRAHAHRPGTQPAPLLFPSSFPFHSLFLYMYSIVCFYFLCLFLAFLGIGANVCKCVDFSLGVGLAIDSGLFVFPSLLPTAHFLSRGSHAPPLPSAYCFLWYIWSSHMGRKHGNLVGGGPSSRTGRGAALVRDGGQNLRAQPGVCFFVCFCLFFRFVSSSRGAGPRDGWMESRCRRQVCDESGQVSLSLRFEIRVLYPPYLPPHDAYLPPAPRQPRFVFASGYLWLLGGLARAVVGWNLASPHTFTRQLVSLMAKVVNGRMGDG